MFILFFLPLLVFGANLEVFLPTRDNLTPVYLSGFTGEMRAVLESDLNRSGVAAVVPREDVLDEALFSAPFDSTLWKKEKIPFCLAAQVVGNRLQMTAFNVAQGTTKKYAPVPLERQAIHKLADAIQKDLFGEEGISSLRLIYTMRKKNLAPAPRKLDWLSEVWICDADGMNAVQVTKENSYCLCPGFMPGSATEFFYVSEKSGQSKIYRASLAKPTGELWIDLRGNQALAALRGSKIAFITDIAGRPDLFVQSLDAAGRMFGKARQLFSAPRATQASPT
ncbi:MAG: hypothetical protein KGQ49_02990, partial [Verrucomicrobia bacterium]|nr:hypothetical protein [Verrucomicrobiota bacterium]